MFTKKSPQILVDQSPKVQAGSERSKAYTTTRSDIAHLVPRTALRVLDVGCSNGALGRALKEVVPERSVFGIEMDPAFVMEAVNHLDHVINANANSLDWAVELGENKFDCIIFADVLEHLIDPVSCLNQAIGHLQPKGCVIVSLPNIRHLSALWSIFFVGRFPARNRGIFDRTHLRWFTLSDAYELVASCGLRVTAVSPALRFGDIGGGRFNRWLNHLPFSLKNWWLVREFLIYQICLRAELVS